MLRRLLPLALCLLMPWAPSHAQRPISIAPETLSSLQFRQIGPAVTGGSIHDVEARRLVHD